LLINRRNEGLGRDSPDNEDIHQFSLAGDSQREGGGQSDTRVGGKSSGIGYLNPRPVEGSLPQAHDVQMGDEFNFSSAAEFDPKSLHFFPL
jgi:hypothetical protein